MASALAVLLLVLVKEGSTKLEKPNFLVVGHCKRRVITIALSI